MKFCHIFLGIAIHRPAKILGYQGNDPRLFFSGGIMGISMGNHGNERLIKWDQLEDHLDII